MLRYVYKSNVYMKSTLGCERERGRDEEKNEEEEKTNYLP